VQVPADTSAGPFVGVAKLARDAGGPPLAVGRMAIDSDKINQSVTKGMRSSFSTHGCTIYGQAGSRASHQRPCPRQYWVTRMLVSAVVEVRMLAETLVLTPHLALASMSPWQVLRRSSRRKVASLVHVYSSDARLIITRGIYSSTSRALANSTNDSR